MNLESRVKIHQLQELAKSLLELRGKFSITEVNSLLDFFIGFLTNLEYYLVPANKEVVTTKPYSLLESAAMIFTSLQRYSHCLSPSFGLL